MDGRVVPALLCLLCAFSSVTSDDGAMTFLTPGKSYAEYRPTWPEIEDIRIELSFRTLTNNAVLLHHTFREVVAGVSYRPELSIRLDHGVLVVEHEYGDVSEKILVAKGMSHDRWHSVRITLSLKDYQLTAKVDERDEKSQGLKAFVETRVGEAYQPGPRTSIISLGGFSPDSLHQPGAFVGCFKDLHLYNGDQEVDLVVHGEDGVTQGCHDACDDENPCQNQGKCVNFYNKVECDCFSTAKHGNHCQIEGLTTVTLTGGEWIRYNVYQDHLSERSHLPGIRIAMEFRTGSPEGVLFYASETSPQYNHLAVSLHNGSIHVSIVFEDRETHSELYTTIGKEINDGRWHALTVTHEGRDIKIELDDQQENMDAKHSHPHFNMPEMVYFAGLDEGNLGIGLHSEETFVGCLRGLYYNHIAVLDHMDDRTHYHGDSPLEYKCQDVHTTSMQFQHDGSYARVISAKQDTLEVEFEFRTYKPDALLFHTDMMTFDYKGYIKAFLVHGKVEVHIVPSSFSPEVRQVITVGKNLNCAQWHTVKVFYRKGMTQVWVNKGFKVELTEWQLTAGEQTYFGYAPDIFHEKKSYIGCMKHLKVQGTEIDPLPIVRSENSVGLTLGSCDLTNWCAKHNPCLQSGLCVSEWFQPYCDCSSTLFEGRHCQFSQLRLTCEEHYLNGERTSGARHIDQDGMGPFPPVHMYCDMGVLVDGRKYGVTTVDHNLYPQTKVRNPNFVDLVKVPKYRGLSNAMLMALVDTSAICRQHMAINCYHAFLGLGKQTFFTSVGDVEFAMVGGTEEGACLCHSDDTCIDNRYQCNCDQRSGKWVSDKAYLTLKEQVPVTSLTFLQEYGGQANISLGPLECMGKVSQSEETAVMFTSPHSFLDVPGWRGGNIEVIFRTLKTSAILLYQHGQNSSYHDTQLVAELVSEHAVVISATRPALHIVLNTSQSLSNGEWQLLKIEVSHNEMKASVGGVKKIVPMPEGRPVPGEDATRLYLGGKPIHYPGQTPGLVGCFGGLLYDDTAISLGQLIGNRADVLPGCYPQCESDPCQNGAICHEFWTSYHCTCANEYAHTGHNCEHDINTNSIKFTNPASHLYFVDPSLEVLGEEYRMSFRSTQQMALVLYIYDHNNNFVQADIEDGDVFHWSYNSGYEIKHLRVTVKGLTDGRWKQAAIFSEQSYLVLGVEGSMVKINDDRMPLMTYTQVPFKNQESVIPFRNMDSPAPGSWVYAGGVPDQFVAFEGLKGCMRGLTVGDTVLDLAGEGQDRDGFLPGCPSGCEIEPCQNGGRCFDDIDFNDAYTCECSGTGQAGKHCDEEVGLYFKGSSQLEQSLRLPPPDAAARGQVDRLELVFATTSHSAKKAAIAFVRGRTGLSDYLLVYLTLDTEVKVAADVQVQDKTVSVIADKHAADGRPHRVVLERQGAKITLQVDDIETETIIEDNVSVSHDEPAILDVGWVRKDNFRFGDFDNFTGDIWNVFFTSDSLGVVNARPMEAYFGYDDGNDGVTTTGVLAPVTQSLTGIESGYMTRDSTSNVWNNGGDGSLEMPPWNPGQAQTIYLVDPNAEDEDTGASPAVAFIVCGIALVFFLGLTAFLILRQRKRRRSFTIKSLANEGDEEEGLLLDKISSVPDDEEPIATAKLRQGPKRSKSTELDAEEDENEETPMLRSEAPMSETAPPGQESIPLDTIKPTDGTSVDEDSEPPPVPPKNPEAPLKEIIKSSESTPMGTETSASASPKDLDATVPVMPDDTYNISVTPATPTTPLDAPKPTSTPTSTTSPAKVEVEKAAEQETPQGTVPDTAADEKGSSVDTTPTNVAGSDPSPADVPNTQVSEALDSKGASQSSVDAENRVDEDSGDDSQKDIQIHAEVYDTPSGSSPGSTTSDELQTKSSEVNGTEAVKQAVTVPKGSSVDPGDDEIIEVVDADDSAKATGANKKGQSKRKGKKKSAKH